MHMRRLADRLVLLRVEVEPIGSEAVHDWHGYLADGGEAPMVAGAPYLAVNP